MLVLTRKEAESIVIGEYGEIRFTVIRVNGDYVRIGIEAPKDIPVHREEIFKEIQRQKRSKKNLE